MKVRGAVAGDAEVLLRLRCALWPDVAVERHRTLIRLRGESSARHETFVVEDGAGTVCGFLELTRDPGAPGEVPTVRVDGVFVVPPSRRRGMARQLVQAAERWAHRRGADSLSCDLESDSGDRAAAMSWLGFGAAEHRVRLRRTVSAPLEMARDAAGVEPAPGPAPAAPGSDPAIVMEPSRGRGFFYFNVVLFALAVVSFLNSNIFSSDTLRGVVLPLLDAVFVIYFLFLFVMHRYGRRADSNARAERLFRDGP